MKEIVGVRFKRVGKIYYFSPVDIQAQVGDYAIVETVRGVECGEVEELAVAGGFGSYLDIGNAVAIGLLPEETREKVRILGNAALAGASMLLLSEGLRGEAAELTRSMEIVSLAANPVFAAEYMERMMF